MPPIKFKSGFGRVYPPPLTAQAGEPVVPESAPEYTPPRLHICSILLLFWCIAFVAMLGSAYIYVLSFPLTPADHVWQAIPIGCALVIPFYGVTLALYKCARRHR